MNTSKAQERRDQLAATMRPRKTDTTAKPPPAVRTKAPRIKPVRAGVDMDPTLHKRLKMWATEQDATLSDVVRVLADLMLTDPDLAKRVETGLDTMARRE